MDVVHLRVLLLAAAFAAAGCAKPSGTQDATAEPDAATGVVQGVVVDAGIRPVALANVSLGINTTVQTDDNGNFAFPPVAPGTYVLRVEHPDFAIAESPIAVSAGVTTQAKVFLVPLRSPVPIHFTQDFHGRVEAGLGVLNEFGEIVLDALGQPNCQCKFEMPVDVGLRSILIEAVWEDNVAPPPGYGPTLYAWDVDIGPAQKTGAGPNPIYKVLVPGDFTVSDETGTHPLQNFTGITNLVIALYPDQTWPAFQQDYDMYVTVWYNGLPPEGWTFVGGSK